MAYVTVQMTYGTTCTMMNDPFAVFDRCMEDLGRCMKQSRAMRYWQRFVPAVPYAVDEGSVDYCSSRPRPAPSTASRQDHRRNRRKAWRAVIAARIAP